MYASLPYVERPEDAGFDAAGMERAYQVIEEFIADRRIPGAVALVGRTDRILRPRAFGCRAWLPKEEPNAIDTLYDCASLTKVVVTAPLVWSLLDRGALRLDDPVALFLPQFAAAQGGQPDAAARETVTIRHLLTHTSGLPGWTPLYQQGSGWDEIVTAVCHTPFEYPAGEKVLYSCLGYILLGEVIRVAYGRPLDQVARESLFQPLHMAGACYNPGDDLRPRIAPTERVEGEVIHGVVHDENARGMGGVSGNAGLFATAEDLARFARMILSRGALGGDGAGSRLFSEAVVTEAARDHTPRLNESRGLGWVVKGAHPHSAAGDLFSAQSFGHTGFTGTSLWFDPVRDLFAILLTNSVHPTRDNVAHRRLRPLFHNAVAAAMRS